MTYPYRNPTRNANGTFNCEIQLEEEWLPFTASSDDSEQKGRDLHALITAENSNIADTPIPVVTLEELQQGATGRVLSVAESTVEALVAKYNLNERLSWSQQAEMAKAQQAGVATTEQTALLSNMAAIRGLADADAMAARIIAKGAQFTQLSVTVASHKNKALDAITAASDEEGINAAVSAFESAVNALGGNHG